MLKNLKNWVIGGYIGISCVFLTASSTYQLLALSDESESQLIAHGGGGRGGGHGGHGGRRGHGMHRGHRGYGGHHWHGGHRGYGWHDGYHHGYHRWNGGHRWDGWHGGYRWVGGYWGRGYYPYGGVYNYYDGVYPLHYNTPPYIHDDSNIDGDSIYYYKTPVDHIYQVLK